ncbi:MAG: hypothetical protein U5L11_02240 [Arhodomonas sp.]|nr:hypothetical protein [Arhodomonas sp.]
MASSSTRRCAISQIELVLTAAPHRSQRVARLLQKYNRIASLLDHQDRLDPTPEEYRGGPSGTASARSHRSGHRRNPSRRPSPLDEARWG